MMSELLKQNAQAFLHEGNGEQATTHFIYSVSDICHPGQVSQQGQASGGVGRWG